MPIERSGGSGTNLVTSVFGRIGDVVAVAGDYLASQVTNAFDKNSSSVQVGAGGFRSSHVTNANGYVGALGVGGTVTQITSRSTAVTLNKLCGQITTDTTSLAAGATVVFTVNNTTVALPSYVIGLSITNSLTSTTGIIYGISGVTSSSFQIWYVNNGTGASTTAYVFNFSIQNSVTT